VPDVRATVEGYEDKSPLYGFLQYRRRKIVLKYAPEGMSRLVQGKPMVPWLCYYFANHAARTTVQFQSILDKFSPQDTTFEFKAPGDLTESALSSACLLHAVSGSITSSSSSLRRRRLMEIAEDAEEGPPPPSTIHTAPPPISPPDDSNDKRLSQMSDATAVPAKNEDDSPITSTSHVLDNDAESRTDTASIHSVSRKRFLDQFHRDSFDRRSSTQSARPTLQELNYAAPYRQKVKLDHRPSVDINNRPRTAGSMSRGPDHRPVAALPAGVRSRKLAGIANRPKSTHDVPPPVPTLASLRNAPPIPLLIPPPTLSIAKPRLSPGAKSMNAIPSSGMSPEKQRLMKALELRKKQMEKKTGGLQKKQEQKSNGTTSNSTVVESLEDKENIGHSPVKKPLSEVTPVEAEPEPAVAASEIDEPKKETLAEAEATPEPPVVTTTEINEPQKEETLAEAEAIPEPPAVTTTERHDEKPLTADLAKADSAVEMVAMASKVEPTSHDEVPNGTVHEENGAEDTHSHADKALQPKPEVEVSLQENAEDNVVDDTTIDLDEFTELSRQETLTQRTADLEYTMTKLPDSPKIEEPEPEPELEVADEKEETVDTQPEAIDESETAQADNEVVGHELDAPDIPLPADEQKEPELEEPAVAVPTEEETPMTGEIPIIVELRAEDIPLPPEFGEDLAEAPTTARRQSALEPVSTAQMQPLPQPEHDRSEKHKRIALLEPIQVPTPDFSDDENFLSDDSLMEELTSATVQEAQPVSVGKGPLSPNGEALEAWQNRSVSNPNRRPSDFSSLPADTRSISATFADGGNQSIRPMVAKKVNVSSGISKRIKALEMFSNTASSPTVNAPNTTSAAAAAATGNVASPTASAFEKFRKRASVSLNGNLPSTTPSARSSFISTSDFPLNRSDSRSISKLNSVSVTARIVRDPSTPPSELNSNPIETSVLGLQRSPLIVKHDSSETQTPDHKPSNGMAEPRSSAFSPRRSRRSSTDTAIASRSDSRASSRSRFDERGRGDTGASPDDKKDSRTSRLMRRMSSLRSSSRKNLMSPPGVDKVDKQRLPSPHAEESVQRPPSRAIDIGEVNVQFPDTLLWKRRYLRIDDQGYLVLTPGSTDTGARNIIKRYHLSEFKTPCLPDEERQELPNSILLDFRDGSTLQCACESRKGQAAALQSK
jgi:hypothetical protein